jgi:hypothetical protein
MIIYFLRLFFVLFFLSTAAAQPPLDSVALWEAFAANPEQHRLIPNNAYAGYARGERPIPDVPAVVDVRSFGARGDGQTLNDATVRRAIDAAWAAGGGAVRFPAGEFVFEDMILLHRDGVVLRGAGPGKTVLRFRRPLVEVLGRTGGEVDQWNWTGGLIWVGPGDDFELQRNGDGGARWHWSGLRETFGEMRERRTRRFRSSWENWRTLGEAGVLARVSSESGRGVRRVRVDDAGGLRAGDRVMMAWENPQDHSLWMEMAGHEAFRDVDWFDGWIEDAVPLWMWPVEILAVEGNEVILTQPTRVSIRPEYKVTFRRIGAERNGHPPLVQEAGVENLTLRMENKRHSYPYNRGVGWNGLFFNRAWNAWARNVEILYAETAVNVSSSKNVTVSGIDVYSPFQSKYISTNRVMSHDILYEDFRVRNTGTISNGMNTEWLSSGNVWSRFDMDRGTFDSHRMMAFDGIRTEIRLRNPSDSRPGGNREAGPFTGRRLVHWNIEVTDSDRPQAERGMWVLDPEQYVSTVMAGIQGAPVFRRESLFGMPPGDKDVRIVDKGRIAEPRNLFEAQRRLRFGSDSVSDEPDLPGAFRRSPHAPGEPYAFFSVTPQSGRAPLTVQLNADLVSGRGDDITALRWDFGDGNAFEGLDRFPVHTFEQEGLYTVALEVGTASGNIARHEVQVPVGNRPPVILANASNAFGAAPLTVEFDASGSDSPYGDIVRYDWAFGDGTRKLDAGAVISHTFTRLGTFTVTLRITDDEGDVAFWEVPVRVSREPQLFARINFQPTSLPAPEGWIAEGRDVFGERVNGMRFGWTPRAGAPRRRNSDRSPDFLHDSLVHSAGSVWEIDVPNGEYEVRLVAGDATNTDSVYRIFVEDVLVVDGRPAPDRPWVTGYARVRVTDGRLTVREAPGAHNVKLAWMEIFYVPEDTP